MDSDLTLDAVDRRILAALQQHGRITFDELAAQVQLSASAVLRRVRRLEDAGVIAGYAAIVPPHKVGLDLAASVEVELHHPVEADQHPLADQFRVAVQDWPEVTECVLLSGEMTFLLRVVVADLAHYSRFMSDTLMRHPGVARCKAGFVLEQIKRARPQPV